MKKIILASASSGRKDLLENIGLKFEVEPSDYAEELIQLSPVSLFWIRVKTRYYPRR